MKLRSRCDGENVNGAFPLSGILGHPTRDNIYYVFPLDICGDTSLRTRSLVPRRVPSPCYLARGVQH